jgi:hypothetical protein
MAALLVGTASGASAADDGVWSIRKASGEVWLATGGAQQVSLQQEETLKAGDTIRTGRNGRVLLVRGEETILISPNSVVGVPAEKTEGLSTTIIQQAGSILLEVEKRNVKHFEVETPYLAAVVKGTHFSVTVNAGNTQVGVLRGQVEVADFKTGQIAQVLPGQTATAFEHGKPGLSLSGSGSLNPIEQGKPRASTIERIPVPKSGLSAPRNAVNGHAIHAIAPTGKGSKAAGAPAQPRRASGTVPARAGVVRISNALGEVKLNFHKVTHGLARDAAAAGSHVRNATNGSTDTVWGDAKAGTTIATGNSSAQSAATMGVSPGAGSIAAASSTTAAGATSDGSGSSSTGGGSLAANGATGNGNGASKNGNNGNGNTNANGNNGNSGNGNSGNGNGNSSSNGNSGNGNNGNGNGNGGVGNGNGNGNAKH